MSDNKMYLTREDLRVVRHLKKVADIAKGKELPKVKVLDEINKKLPITEN